jgi:pilus assembly protein CpaB
MNKAQIAVLAVALAAGGAAFLMMSGQNAPAPVAQAPSTVDDVLVATRDLSYGAALIDNDTSWIPWPKDYVPKGVIRKSEAANVKEDIRGAYVRTPVATGEPIRRERLVKGQTAGMMSTMLPSGKRAIAIDVSVNTTAGGFILPNDHVDVIRTFRDQDQTKERGVEVVSSEVVLSNVRVLAMGQTVETKNSEVVVTNSTATLELDPRQAELVVLAQKTGTLALALRALVDAQKDDPAADLSQDGSAGPMTVVRHGISSILQSR